MVLETSIHPIKKSLGGSEKKAEFPGEHKTKMEPPQISLLIGGREKPASNGTLPAANCTGQTRKSQVGKKKGSTYKNLGRVTQGWRRLMNQTKQKQANPPSSPDCTHTWEEIKVVSKKRINKGKNEGNGESTPGWRVHQRQL